MQVYPFILRGTRMLGIYSAESPLSYKQVLWDKIAEIWSVDLESLTHEINLEEVPSVLEKCYRGIVAVVTWLKFTKFDACLIRNFGE